MFAKTSFIMLLACMLASNTVSAKVKSSEAKNYGAQICDSVDFICYKVKRGDTWEILFSDSDKRDLVMRINRMNTKLHAGLIIAIPKKYDKTLMDYSPLAQQIDPPGEKVIIVSIHNLAFGAYNPDGTLQHWGPISAARGYCPDIGKGCHTAIGKFAIYQKEGAGCVSTKFPVGRGGAPMPYCMFFHGGFALHGSYEVPGYNDSHGCVRMFVNDAKWLNQEFTYGAGNVTVIINK